jgi:hypothetical protein
MAIHLKHVLKLAETLFDSGARLVVLGRFHCSQRGDVRTAGMDFTQVHLWSPNIPSSEQDSSFGPLQQSTTSIQRCSQFNGTLYVPLVWKQVCGRKVTVVLSMPSAILSKAPESATATYPSNTTNITMSRYIGPCREEITLLERSTSVSKTCSLY